MKKTALVSAVAVSALMTLSAEAGPQKGGKGQMLRDGSCTTQIITGTSGAAEVDYLMMQGYGDGTGTQPLDGTGSGPGDGTQPRPQDGTGFGRGANR